MALLNKLLGKDEREESLKKEIKSLEVRKESVLASIDGEIRRLETEKRALFLEAGESAYETWRANKTQADLTGYWEQAKELDVKIAVQESKKKEMTDRYDEEIKLIASNLTMAVSAGNPTLVVSIPASSAVCPNCGMAIADDDIFCQGCGTKLQ